MKVGTLIRINPDEVTSGERGLLRDHGTLWVVIPHRTGEGDSVWARSLATNYTHLWYRREFEHGDR